MKHEIHKVRAFEIVQPFCIRVEFADGLSRTVDFRPVLAGEVYGPLRDLELFNQVALDSEVHTIVWPNGADFDPATLHDWPAHLPELLARARKWEFATA